MLSYSKRQQDKRSNESLKQSENNKMVMVRSYLLIIMLTINGLNFSVKRCRWLNGFQKIQWSPTILTLALKTHIATPVPRLNWWWAESELAEACWQDLARDQQLGSLWRLTGGLYACLWESSSMASSAWDGVPPRLQQCVDPGFAPNHHTEVAP